MIQMDIRWTAVQLNLQSWNIENLVVLDCDQLIRWSDGSFLVGGDKEQLLKQVCLVRDSPSEPLYRESSSRLAGDLPQKSKISRCFGESKLDTECCWYKAFP